jgi:hypothetical protein
MEKSSEFFKMSSGDKVEFLKKRLYGLYNHKLKICENGLDANLIDRDIDRLEKQIQEIQIDMWE